MRIARITIKNFRGIAEAKVNFQGHTVIIGDNNSGKSSLLEAIDLVLGPDRLSRAAPIDEHDFYASRYLDSEENPVPIEIEVIVVDLSPEQIRHFNANLEFWNESSSALVNGPPITGVESSSVKEALRVGFRGWYEQDEDDFKAETFFCWPESDTGKQPTFYSKDKRKCGFLLLRALRTGARALSLERGSLLDVILRVREIRPKMWEQVLDQLRKLQVAEDPSIGLSGILTEIQAAIRQFVPFDWAADPHLRVSDLTREHLRRTLTVFMATGAIGDGSHAAPFQHQGTGTINMLVLALLSMIADAKQSVIFAMEEPETAIPPSSQKSIVLGVTSKSAQAIFTSHSPYVLEEFDPNQIMVLSREAGVLTGKQVKFPKHIRPKLYASEFRMRFAEALLSRRVLIAEGRTEASAYSAAARRLAELDNKTYSSLESLCIAVFDAQSDSKIASFGAFFRDLGKQLFAVYDKQNNASQKAQIEAAIHYPFESEADDFEASLLTEIPEVSLRRFCENVVAAGDWPPHLRYCQPNAAMAFSDVRDALHKYLESGKASGTAGDLLANCSVDEMPATVKNVLAKIKDTVCLPEIAVATTAGASTTTSVVSEAASDSSTA